MSVTYGPNAVFTPANGLTLARLAMTPAMLGLILELRFDHPTFWLWVTLCCTDGIDGYVARRMGSTRSGAFLDPLADKFLVLGGMFALVAKQVFFWPLVAVIAVREVAMSVYRSRLSRAGISLPARYSAKVKAFVQQIAVGFAIMPWVGENADWIGRGLLVVATALTVVTGLQYALEARHVRARTA